MCVIKLLNSYIVLKTSLVIDKNVSLLLLCSHI